MSEIGKILVVDDSADSVDLMTLDLEDEGYAVVTAHDGCSGLETAARELPDVILLDNMMPGMTGIEVCRRLKEIPELRPIPVIVVSNRIDEEGIVEGFAAGAHDYITKPISPALFLARVRSALRIKFAQDETSKVNQLLEESQAAARSDSQFKTDFLAHMSHEIRTPLAGIIGISRLLLDEDVSDDVREMIVTISDCGDSLLSLINDILDISKIEAGRVELEITNFTLRNCISRTCDIEKAKVEAKGLVLTVQIDEDVPESIVGDPGRLQQILLNLINNAVKFTEEGEIVLRVTTKEQHEDSVSLRFEVRDTGIGMSAEALERLFDAYAQANASTARTYGGTGLGMTISQSLVGLMGGSISVKSTEGKGTTFEFTVAFGATEKTTG